MEFTSSFASEMINKKGSYSFFYSNLCDLCVIWTEVGVWKEKAWFLEESEKIEESVKSRTNCLQHYITLLNIRRTLLQKSNHYF